MSDRLAGRSQALTAIDALLRRLRAGAGGTVLLAAPPWMGAGAVLREAQRRAEAEGLASRWSDVGDVGTGPLLVLDPGEDPRRLAALAAVTAERPVALLSVVRPGAAALDPELARAEALALAVVTLEPLAPQAGAALAARLGAADGSAVAALAGGRPGLIAQLAPDASTAAERLGRLLRGALLDAGADAAALAEVLAVLGQDDTEPATWGEAAAAAAIGHDASAGAVDALTALGLVTGAPRLAWPAAAQALLDGLPDGLRARRERAVAVAREAAGRPAAVVGAHAARALPCGDAWVVGALRAAARARRAAGDPAGAVPLLRRALDEPPPREARTGLLSELAQALGAAGDRSADAVWAQAIAATDDRALLARTWSERGHQAMLDGKPAAAQAAFDSGLAVVDAERDALLHRDLVAARAGAIAFGLADMGLVELDALIVDVPGPLTRSERALRAQAALVGGRTGQLSSERVVQLARWARDGDAILQDGGIEGPSVSLVTGAYYFVGALQESLALIDTGIADAERRGSVFGVALGRYLRSAPLLRLGRVAEACAECQIADAALPGGTGIWAPAIDRTLALAAVELGEPQRALGLIERRKEEARNAEAIWPVFFNTRGEIRRAAGDPAGALDDHVAAGELLRATGDSNPTILAAWRSGAARALVALGRAGEAVPLAEEELALARAWGAPEPIAYALVSLGLAQGRTRGLEALAEAVALLQTSECVLDRVAAQVELGAALRRAGRRADAREPLAAALDAAQRLGLVALRDRADEELRASGARPRRRERHGVASLTPTELRVVRLAAGGLDNPGIASELYVARKTVEYHLSNAYRKLDIADRSELPPLLSAAEDDQPAG